MMPKNVQAVKVPFSHLSIDIRSSSDGRRSQFVKVLLLSSNG